jgi:hypothetical protein
MRAATSLQKEVDRQHDEHDDRESAPQHWSADRMHTIFLTHKNKNGYGQKTIAVSFLCIDLAFRQGLTYNQKGFCCPATGCDFARIVMTIHRQEVTPFAGNKICQTIGFVNGLHGFITQLYAIASALTPSAGNTTPV